MKSVPSAVTFKVSEDSDKIRENENAGSARFAGKRCLAESACGGPVVDSGDGAVGSEWAWVGDTWVDMEGYVGTGDMCV